MRYQFTVRIKFRNGKTLTVYSNDCNLRNDGLTPRARLYFHNEPQINIKSGSPNTFREGEYYLYNGSPVKQNLFELFPGDWDKEDEQFNVIDEIIVNSKGVDVDE